MSINQGFSYRGRIERPLDAERLVDYLSRRYPHSSPADWRARIVAGLVVLDGVRADPEARVTRGQQLIWNRPPWSEPAAEVGWAILLEDEDVLAVAKPSGLPTLPGAGYLETTLLRAVQSRVPGASPIHRLGRWTSGVVLFAKSDRAREGLSLQWRRRDIGKIYRALASGTPNFERLDITVPIGPVPHARLGTVHAASSAGRPALSRIQVLERRTGAFLCDVRIETGRPHQIRIHLAAAGHPLAGDPLYGPGGIPVADCVALPGDPGYALHALELSFDHPRTGAPMRVFCPPTEPLQLTPATAVPSAAPNP